MAHTPRLEFRLPIVEFSDDAAQALLAEGHDDAPTNAGFGVGDAIGEGGIERDWQGHIAELRHETLAASAARWGGLSPR